MAAMELTTGAGMPVSAVPLIDGHTHVDQYGGAEIEGVLERASAAGVGLIIAAGVSIPSSRRIQVLAESHPIVRAGVGIHPSDLPPVVDGAVETELRRLAEHPAVAVWSETGLDALPASPPADLQQRAFRMQIRLAREFDLPLVVHSRGTDAEVLRALREEGAGEVGGAWHYFGGDLHLADAIIDLGFHVSFAKTLLRSPELQVVAAQVPLERVVIETDSYPQPFKKKRERWTEPWNLPQVAAKLAEVKGIAPDEVGRAATANYLRMARSRLADLALPLPVRAEPASAPRT